MSGPPKYPRMAHLVASPAASADDLVLSGFHELLGSEVIIEEKLDGMNVMVWSEGGVPHVGTRGGEATADRSGERGRLRAWAAMRADALGAVLGDGQVLYGEWLRRRHAVAYTRLPAELVGLDVLDRASGAFLLPAERDAVLERLGVPAPPVRWRGVLQSIEGLPGLLGPSAYGAPRGEGLVVRRTEAGTPRTAKFVDPAWRGIGEHPWHGENVISSGPAMLAE